jgi:hypothetical protein
LHTRMHKPGPPHFPPLFGVTASTHFLESRGIIGPKRSIRPIP